MADERPGQTRMRHDEADSSIQIHSILPFVKIERRTSRGDRDVTPLSNTVLSFVPIIQNENGDVS